MKRNIEQNRYEEPSIRLFSIKAKSVICQSDPTPTEMEEGDDNI